MSTHRLQEMLKMMANNQEGEYSNEESEDRMAQPVSDDSWETEEQYEPEDEDYINLG